METEVQTLSKIFEQCSIAQLVKFWAYLAGLNPSDNESDSDTGDGFYFVEFLWKQCAPHELLCEW